MLEAIQEVLGFTLFLSLFVLTIVFTRSIYDTYKNNKALKLENTKLARKLQEEKEKQDFLNSIR